MEIGVPLSAFCVLNCNNCSVLQSFKLCKEAMENVEKGEHPSSLGLLKNIKKLPKAKYSRAEIKHFVNICM